MKDKKILIKIASITVLVIVGLIYLTFRSNLVVNKSSNLKNAPTSKPMLTQTQGTDYFLTEKDNKLYYQSDKKNFSLYFSKEWSVVESSSKSELTSNFLRLKNDNIQLDVVLDAEMPFGFENAKIIQTPMQVTLNNRVILEGNKFTNQETGYIFVALGSKKGRTVSVRVTLPLKEDIKLVDAIKIIQTMVY